MRNRALGENWYPCERRNEEPCATWTLLPVTLPSNSVTGGARVKGPGNGNRNATQTLAKTGEASEPAR
eukprot:7407480-Lingulodinium_polyedra.AAC.1